MNVETGAGAARDVYHRQDQVRARSVEAAHKADDEQRSRDKAAVAAAPAEKDDKTTVQRQDPGPDAGRKVDISV